VNTRLVHQHFHETWIANVVRQDAFDRDRFFEPFLVTGLLSLVIAFLTVSYQAIRAARANPVDSLRYE
jgi:ABC-type lipoprotein release transport system permease subunit